MGAITFVRSLKIEKVQRFGGILRLRVDKSLSAKVIEIEGLKKFGEILDGVSDAYMFVEGYQMKLGIYPQESKITSKTHQRFQIQEKKMNLVLNSQLKVEGLPVYSLKFGVPPDYKILEVISKGLTDWACVDDHLMLKYSRGLLGSNTIYVVVLPVVKLEVKLLEAPESIIAGEDYKSRFVIVNQSNTENAVKIRIDSSDNLPFAVDADTFRLAPGESKKVNVTVRTDTEITEVLNSKL